MVKNLPRDTISKFFEHRTTRYQIIAGDTRGRVAAMQKQRFVFLSFVFTCIVVIALAFISSTRNEVESPVHNPAPAGYEDFAARPLRGYESEPFERKGPHRTRTLPLKRNTPEE